MENKQDKLILVIEQLLNQTVDASRQYDAVFGDDKGCEVPYMALEIRGRLNSVMESVKSIYEELQSENMY